MKEPHARVFGIRPEERGAYRLGEAETDGPTDERTEQIGDFGRTHARFDQDRQNAERGAAGEIDLNRCMKRTGEERSPGDSKYKNKPDQEEPGHTPILSVPAVRGSRFGVRGSGYLMANFRASIFGLSLTLRNRMSSTTSPPTSSSRRRGQLSPSSFRYSESTHLRSTSSSGTEAISPG